MPKTKPQLPSLHGNVRRMCSAEVSVFPPRPRGAKHAPAFRSSSRAPAVAGPERYRPGHCAASGRHREGLEGAAAQGTPGTKEPYISKEGLLQGQLGPAHPKWTQRLGRAHLGDRRRSGVRALTGPAGEGQERGLAQALWALGCLTGGSAFTVGLWGPPGGCLPGSALLGAPWGHRHSHLEGAAPTQEEDSGLREPGPQSAENCLSHGDAASLPGTASGEAMPG